MSNQQKQSMYVGSANEISNGAGLKIQLDLTELFEYTKGAAKHKIKEWTDKNGKVHKSIDLAVFPLKPENRTTYRTHSVKIDDWEKPTNGNPQQPIKVNHEETPF